MSAVLPGSAARTEAIRPLAPSGGVTPTLLSADERLVASRSRLRTAMMEISHPAPRQRAAVSGGTESVSDDVLRWARGLPGANLIIESLQDWWRQHPLHTAGTVAGNLLSPMARQNPLAFVGVALVVGAVVVATRPWRWLLRPALFIGLIPQVLSHVVKRFPIETWIGLAARLTRTIKKKTFGKKARGRASAQDPAQAGAAAAPSR